jgi:hypothetical protein
VRHRRRPQPLAEPVLRGDDAASAVAVTERAKLSSGRPVLAPAR